MASELLNSQDSQQILRASPNFEEMSTHATVQSIGMGSIEHFDAGIPSILKDEKPRVYAEALCSPQHLQSAQPSVTTELTAARWRNFASYDDGMYFADDKRRRVQLRWADRKGKEKKERKKDRPESQ